MFIRMGEEGREQGRAGPQDSGWRLLVLRNKKLL